MKILVTGFQKFLGQDINPSEKLALELVQLNQNIDALILPVEFKKSFEILIEKVIRTKPDYIIMLGQALGRKNICLEKIGINWIQTEHPDESGIIPTAGKISNEGSLALVSGFPVEDIYFSLKKKNLPVEISFSAGTYVCNDLYYRTLAEFKNIKSVFIHVPLLPEQVQVGETIPSVVFNVQLAVVKEILAELA